VGKNCVYVDAKCSVCGEAGHYAKDCKGKGASFFMMAAKVLEGKNFAKQQAAMRAAENDKKLDQLLGWTKSSSSAEDAQRPTDLLTDGAPAPPGPDGAPKPSRNRLRIQRKRHPEADQPQASRNVRVPCSLAGPPTPSPSLQGGR